jgi:hypothetical protein
VATKAAMRHFEEDEDRMLAELLAATVESSESFDLVRKKLEMKRELLFHRTTINAARKALRFISVRHSTHRTSIFLQCVLF